MAEVTSNNPTLVDVTKRLDPGGKIDKIVEGLDKTNPILQDMTWQEGNLPTGHRYTSRTGLPSLTWREFNKGVAPSKSATDNYEETCGMLEGMAKVDVDLANLNGNSAAFRFSEDRAFLTQFNIEVATGLFYYNAVTNPERFTGLTPRMNSLTTGDAASQVVSCPYISTGSPDGADNYSIWLINWSPDTIFGIFPKGSKAGLSSEDLGKQLVTDRGGTNEYLAWVTRWQWQLGLCVRDYRYVSRLCNLDYGKWKDDLSTGADIAMGMLDQISKIESLSVGRPVFYMNRATYTMLNKQLIKRQANWLEMVDRGGRRIPSFYGIPITIVDALVAENVVT